MGFFAERSNFTVRDSAGGTIIGDLPPYEAFPIGGTNSVRGYSEGGVGSGRTFGVGTAELHWPLYGPIMVRTLQSNMSHFLRQ